MANPRRHYSQQYYLRHREAYQHRNKVRYAQVRNLPIYRAKNSKNNREWYRKNPLRRVARIYGLTIEQYEQLIKGPCMICRQLPSEHKLHIDHCHTTNKVRGALCRACNLGLGEFRDNILLLESAINYLKANG